MMATRDMRYRKRTYGMSEEASFQIDRLFRQARPQPRKPRSDRKYLTNAARQRAYRDRLRGQVPTETEWQELGRALIDYVDMIWQRDGDGGAQRVRIYALLRIFNKLAGLHHQTRRLEWAGPE
jgi:hypothetical protein